LLIGWPIEHQRIAVFIKQKRRRYVICKRPKAAHHYVIFGKSDDNKLKGLSIKDVRRQGFVQCGNFADMEGGSNADVRIFWYKK